MVTERRRKEMVDIMNYISTRGMSEPVESKAAILKGLAPDGGLYVPDAIPTAPPELIGAMPKMTYQEVAESILALYLTDFSDDDIKESVSGAYGSDRFDVDEIAPVRALCQTSVDSSSDTAEVTDYTSASIKNMAVDETFAYTSASIKNGEVDEMSACVAANTDDVPACDENSSSGGAPGCVADALTSGNMIYMLELSHGPTSAFKDMALQLLPRLLVKASRDSGDKSEIVILVATSGDTGKAALEGFRDVPGTRVVVFYPENGVSEVQKLQMVTQQGNNVGVIAVNGNFDDAQTGVKNIFSDEMFNSRLRAAGKKLSSANSINWGRLVPQIAYYFWAYSRLISNGAAKLGEKIVFTVPTGNFGNILACWYACKMGLPVSRIICASNSNKVLTDFIETGVYDRRREFVTTMSPSMDILISSNLERLLFEVADRDAPTVKRWMESLSRDGVYDVGAEGLKRIRELFRGGYATERETGNAIKTVFDRCGYLMDTHTAVGMRVYSEYLESSGDISPVVIVSTASPFKFAADVLESITSKDVAAQSNVKTEDVAVPSNAKSSDATVPSNAQPTVAVVPSSTKPEDEIECLNTLAALSGLSIPGPLKDLDKKSRVHFAVSEKENMMDALEGTLFNGGKGKKG